MTIMKKIHNLVIKRIELIICKGESNELSTSLTKVYRSDKFS